MNFRVHMKRKVSLVAFVVSSLLWTAILLLLLWVIR